MTRAQRAIHALRTPDAALQRVPNTIRQSFADIIEEQRALIDKYGLALMMIGEGCAEPAELARRTVSDMTKDSNPSGIREGK